MKTRLLDLFEARSGVVCVVGAGGKKTTMYRLATAHPGKVGITSTVLTPPFRKRLGAHVVVEDREHLTSVVGVAAQRYKRVAFATPCDKPARVGGVEPRQIIDIHNHAGFDVCIVKGDGARLRWIKAPGENEPVIPPSSVVIPILSAHAIGEPLSEKITHRLREFSEVTGAQPGDPITPELVARLLASERGSLKNVGAARVIVVINMVDTSRYSTVARDVAKQALELSSKIVRVVLAKMIDEDPVVDVVER